LTFSANPEGHVDVYVVNANGGSPQCLTSDSRGSDNPSWSRDGKWILFEVYDSGKTVIYKVPGEGGAPVLVTNKAGWAPVESSDGRFIYGFKNELGGISLWKVPSAGGEERKVLDSLDPDAIELVEDGVYFLRSGKQASDVSLQFLNTNTGKTERIASFSKPIGGFSVSPDRRWIVYGQLDHSGSDLMLVENFR
jgi:Tol biopolymer transport system component